MSLIEIKAEPELLKRLLAVGERIASALERAYPEPAVIMPHKPYGVEALITFDPEKQFELEEEESRQRENGLIP
jgi:hypothetical protein